MSCAIFPSLIELVYQFSSKFVHLSMSHLNQYPIGTFAYLAGAVEYTDCFSAEG